MKKLTLRLIAVMIIIFFAGHAFASISKITPIKALVILCESRRPSECSTAAMDYYLNKLPIPVISRENLKSIMNEQSLQTSGLTEKVIKAGRLLGASHILLYTNESDQDSISFYFKLINIETSEIEYIGKTLNLNLAMQDILNKALPGSKTFTLQDFFDLLSANKDEQKDTALDDLIKKKTTKELLDVIEKSK